MEAASGSANPAPGKRGPLARIVKELRRWRRPRTKLPPAPRRPLALGREPFEIHTLVCRRDVAMSLWSLRSLFAQSGLRPRVVVHDDGTLRREHREHYAKHFEGIEILDDATASARMDELLEPWPTCRRYRRHPRFYCARKLFDIVFLAQSPTVVQVDSDVLFFREPAELFAMARRGEACFGSDYQDAYSAPRADLEQWRGRALLPRVNAGLLSVPVAEYRSRMNLVEDYLARASLETPDVPVNRHEQTAHALLMSGIGATRLPSTYALNGPIDARTIAFHFVNDGTNRPRFWREGVPAVSRAVRGCSA